MQFGKSGRKSVVRSVRANQHENMLYKFTIIILWIHCNQCPAQQQVICGKNSDLYMKSSHTNGLSLETFSPYLWNIFS